MRKAKKLFGISTELVRLDIKEILANYRKPQYWKKVWTIFKCKDFDVVWKMTSIDLEDNKIRSQTKIINYKGKNKKSLYYNCQCDCSSIPIDNPDYTQENFIRNISSAVKTSLDRLERDIVEQTYEYQQAVKLSREEVDKLEEIANDFLDNENVTNQDIRDAYINWYIDNTSTFNYTSEILSNAIRKYYPTVRLLLHSWFGNKKAFEEETKFLKENKNIKKKYCYQIWKNMKELDSEDYLLQAQEQLGNI